MGGEFERVLLDFLRGRRRASALRDVLCHALHERRVFIHADRLGVPVRWRSRETRTRGMPGSQKARPPWVALALTTLFSGALPGQVGHDCTFRA